jgi:hypothetical protein
VVSFRVNKSSGKQKKGDKVIFVWLLAYVDEIEFFFVSWWRCGERSEANRSDSA